jgi:hypothetical protein
MRSVLPCTFSCTFSCTYSCLTPTRNRWKRRHARTSAVGLAMFGLLEMQ